VGSGAWQGAAAAPRLKLASVPARRQRPAGPVEPVRRESTVHSGKGQHAHRYRMTLVVGVEAADWADSQCPFQRSVKCSIELCVSRFAQGPFRRLRIRTAVRLKLIVMVR
jgi:hypothetical protein